MDRKGKEVVEGWLDSQRGRPQARAMRSAGFTANKVLRPLARRHGKTTSISVLRANWHQFAGKYAKLSRPVRVQGTKGGRTVVVEAQGPAASLVSASSGQILSRINAFVGGSSTPSGDGGFTALRVVQAAMDAPVAPVQPARGLSPSQAQALDRRLSDVDSPELRAALEKLGRNVISRDTP